MLQLRDYLWKHRALPETKQERLLRCKLPLPLMNEEGTKPPNPFHIPELRGEIVSYLESPIDMRFYPRNAYIYKEGYVENISTYTSKQLD